MLAHIALLVQLRMFRVLPAISARLQSSSRLASQDLFARPLASRHRRLYAASILLARQTQPLARRVLRFRTRPSARPPVHHAVHALVRFHFALCLCMRCCAILSRVPCLKLISACSSSDSDCTAKHWPVRRARAGRDFIHWYTILYLFSEQCFVCFHILHSASTLVILELIR